MSKVLILEAAQLLQQVHVVVEEQLVLLQGRGLFDQQLELLFFLFQGLQFQFHLLPIIAAEVGATEHCDVEVVVVELVEADSLGGAGSVQGVFLGLAAALQTSGNYNLFQALLNFFLIKEVFGQQPTDGALLRIGEQELLGGDVAEAEQVDGLRSVGDGNPVVEHVLGLVVFVQRKYGIAHEVAENMLDEGDCGLRMVGNGSARGGLQWEQAELPQLLVILLTAALFDGGNSNLHDDLLLVLVPLLGFQFGQFVSDLVVLFADQHLRDALLVILRLLHVPYFFPDFPQVLVQPRVAVQPLLQHSFRQARHQLHLFSEASHIQIIILSNKIGHFLVRQLRNHQQAPPLHSNSFMLVYQAWAATSQISIQGAQSTSKALFHAYFNIFIISSYRALACSPDCSLRPHWPHPITPVLQHIFVQTLFTNCRYAPIYSILSIYMSQNTCASWELPNTLIPVSDSLPHLTTVQVVENGQVVEKCTIGKYQFSKKDFLGEGLSSSVYKATLLTNKKQRFAIKVIDLSKFEENERSLLESEIEIIRSLNHDNIIRCVDVYRTDAHYFLVTEYCPHGDLSELIQLQKYITEDKSIEIMRQILNGYKYLMARNIIHRDLKPANVMRFGSHWKIGDFGFSCYCKDEYILEKLYVGTPSYMPPESIEMNKYSPKSDIFALGVIFYEMLTGSTPWPAKDQKELLDSMRENQLEVPRFLVSEQSRLFLERSVVLDYYQRMSKDELRKFSFDLVDIQKVSKLKPRGLSPCLKRELSKSGKKSFFFATPNKFAKNSFFTQMIKQDIPIKISVDGKKHTFEQAKPQLIESTGESSPVTIKSLKENSEIINHELELVKVLINLVHSCSVFDLPKYEQGVFCMVIYEISLKMLKMVSTKRQNYYRLSKWDVYRQSQKYRVCATSVFTYANKIESELEAYKKSIDPATLEEFNLRYPELAGNGSLNFKIYASLFKKLCSFVGQNLRYSNEQVISQPMLGRKCYALRQVIEMLTTIRYRSTREQEVKGFGLILKPACLQVKNATWSEQALSLSFKQLGMLCQHKIQKD